MNTASVMTDMIVYFDERKRKKIGKDGGDGEAISLVLLKELKERRTRDIGYK